MLAYFPVMGIGALLISPTLPMHKQCASCASFHLSRQCNTTPSLPHSAGVTLSGGEFWAYSMQYDERQLRDPRDPADFT